MKDLLKALGLIVLLILVVYIATPSTPPVAPGTPPVAIPDKPQPIVIKTLVDYYADWCGPCKAAKPKVDELEKLGVKVIRVNADKKPELLKENSVTSLPTFICTIREGTVTRFIRTQNIDEVVRFFK